MRALLAAALALWAAAAAAAERVPLPDAEAARWRAVGRLNAAGAQFCTAALIAPTLVVTAAHCLTLARTGAPVRPEALRFVAGYRRGGYAALRRVTRMALIGPAEGSDVALLELDRPIPPEQIAPLAVAEARQGPAAVVSYARDRPHAPSISRDCPLRPEGPTLIALGCRAVGGMSGAPVLSGSGPAAAVVGLVSHVDDGGRAYAVALAPALPVLMRRLEQAGPARPKGASAP